MSERDVDEAALRRQLAEARAEVERLRATLHAEMQARRVAESQLDLSQTNLWEKQARLEQQIDTIIRVGEDRDQAIERAEGAQASERDARFFLHHAELANDAFRAELAEARLLEESLRECDRMHLGMLEEARAEVECLTAELAAGRDRAEAAERERDKAQAETAKLNEELGRAMIVEAQTGWETENLRERAILAERLTQERDQANERARKAAAESARLLAAAIQGDHEIQQILGRALGCPWYKDDPVNFPAVTEADGVCTGDSTGASLALEAVRRLARLEEAARHIIDVARHGIPVTLIADLSAAIEQIREALEGKGDALTG